MSLEDVNKSEELRMKDNELIAEFMGLPKEDGFYYIEEPVNKYTVEELLYHSSWDWLMPVVEKIQTMNNCKYIVEITYGYCVINVGTKEKPFYLKGYGEDDTLLGVYSAIVQFIKWYNKENNIRLS